MIKTCLPIGDYVVRSYQPDDVDAIVRYANNRNISINLRDLFPYPYTRTDGEAWMRIALTQNPETNFAIAGKLEVIGGIGLALQQDVHRRSAELGYWLGEPFWGKGITTNAVRAVTEYGFTRLKLIRIFAPVFAWNRASARVLEKAGYSLEGTMRSAVVKDGRVTDMWIYASVQDPAA